MSEILEKARPKAGGQIFYAEACDDVNGDGTSFVGYVTATIVRFDACGVPSPQVLGTFTDETMAVPYTPVNPGDCPTVEEGAEVITVDRDHFCDDVNGDGSDYVPYVSIFKVVCNPDGSITRNPIGIFTDETMTTPYTPINPSDCPAPVAPELGVQVIDLDHDCGCDDIAGDGTDIAFYVTTWKTVCNPADGSISRQLVGTFTDHTMTTPYIPVNPVECCDIGDPADPAPYPDSYVDINPVCVTVNGAGPVAAMQLVVRNKTTHIRIDTLYEDPDTGVRFDPSIIDLVDAQLCCAGGN